MSTIINRPESGSCPSTGGQMEYLGKCKRAISLQKLLIVPWVVTYSSVRFHWTGEYYDENSQDAICLMNGDKTWMYTSHCSILSLPWDLVTLIVARPLELLQVTQYFWLFTRGADRSVAMNDIINRLSLMISNQYQVHILWIQHNQHCLKISVHAVSSCASSKLT